MYSRERYPINAGTNTRESGTAGGIYTRESGTAGGIYTRESGTAGYGNSTDYNTQTIPNNEVYNNANYGNMYSFEDYDAINVNLETEYSEQHNEAEQHELPLDENESSIFISIASYRDVECQKTVKDMIAKARNPERLVIGICEQNYSSDEPCIDSATLSKLQNQIRIKRIAAVDAKGPAYARAIIENELYAPNETELYLQIDSHMRFTKHWDVQCIRELSLCPHDKCILTMYPEEYTRTATTWNFPKVAKPKFISFHSWHKRTGFPMQDSKTFASYPTKPWPSAYFAANFAFGRSQAWTDVPNDIDVPYLFLGEEQSMAARFYTHGYDLHSPMTMLLYTLNDRSYRSTFWEQLYKKFEVADERTCNERKQIEQQSVDRIRSLLCTGSLTKPEDNDVFGLGNIRTLKEYEEYSGYDFNAQIATPRARLGISFEGHDEEWKQKLNCNKRDWKNVFTKSLSVNNAPLEGPVDPTKISTYMPGQNLYKSQNSNFVGYKQRMKNVSGSSAMANRSNKNNNNNNSSLNRQSNNPNGAPNSAFRNIDALNNMNKTNAKKAIEHRAMIASNSNINGQPGITTARQRTISK